MLDHVGIAVADTGQSKAFYDAALAPIGITMIAEVPGNVTDSGGTACGYGKDEKPFFWFGDNEQVGEGFHVAFAVETRASGRCLLRSRDCSGRNRQWRARVCGHIIIPIIMARSCSTLMVIMSRPSAIHPNERQR